MARSYLALWLPYFATDRLGRTTDPLVTLTEQAGVPRVTAVNKAALQLGIGAGMALADARALYPALDTRQANPLREQRSLTRLADWCGRYSPSVAFDGTDGLMIDITGCDHLFGGQAAMLGDLTARIEGLGFTATAAIAPTPGAAWALARYATPGTVVSDPACLPDRLAPLPLAALRLQPETVAMLAQVGLRQIGDLLNLLSSHRLMCANGFQIVKKRFSAGNSNHFITFAIQYIYCHATNTTTGSSNNNRPFIR